MKKNRIVFGLLWVLSLVGISFFGGNISYSIFTMLTLIPVVCMVYLLCVFFGFRIYQKLDTNRLVANQTVPFFFTLKNEFFFGFVGIKVRFFSSFSTISGLDDNIEYELFPGQGIEKQTSLVCKYRGEYEVGIKTVELQDFLRLFKLSYRNPETLRVIARPNLVYLTKLKREDVSTQMLQMQSMVENEPDILVREYIPGDDVRHIHWKNTASTGKLMVRGRIGDAKQGVGMVFDTLRIDEKPERYLPVENKLLEATLALTYYYVQGMVPVTAFYHQASLQTMILKNEAAFESFYEAVAGVSFENTERVGTLYDSLSRNPDIYHCKVVYVMISKWNERVEHFVKQLSQNQVEVLVYLFSSETNVGQEVLERIARVSIYQIGSEADLLEVL